MPTASGRPTAAEQGAALRQSILAKQQGRGSGGGGSQRNSTARHSRDVDDSPRHSRHVQEPQPSERRRSARVSDEPQRESAHAQAAASPAPEVAAADSGRRSSQKSQQTVVAALPSPTDHNNEKPQPKQASKAKRKTPFNMKRIETLSGIDNLALLLEDETYHPACFSIYMFESDLDRQTVEDFFEKLVELFPKYRYKVDLDPAQSAKLDKRERAHEHTAEGAQAARQDRKDNPDWGRKTRYAKGIKAGGPFRPAKWRVLDDFDIRENIEETSLSAPANKDEDLFELAGRFLERHFNYRKPLWEALLVHGLDMADGSKSGLMIKIHHTLSDGQGLIQSYGVALAAIEHNMSKEEVEAKFDSSPDAKPGSRGVKPTLWGTIKHGAKTARGLYLRSRTSFVYPPTAPKHRVAARRYAHSRGIDMDDIKLIREAFSTEKERLTLNDVACAVLSKSMAIAARRVAPDGKVRDKRIAIFVPISVRPKGNYELANYTTGAIAWFAMDEHMSLEDRLAQVNREMMRIKRSHLPKLWYSSFDFICKHRAWYTPHYPLGKEFFQKAYREYSVATNVPGPAKPLKFGTHVANRYFVMPPSSPGKGTLAIGLISYAGSLSVAVSCDDIPEFRSLAKDICDAFQDGAQDLINAAKAKVAAAGGEKGPRA